MNRYILLSFDLEEFDIPQEYGQSIEESLQFSVSLAGSERVLALLQQLNIRATFFVTAHFARNHPDHVRTIAQSHEIASHGFYHSAFEAADLARSKAVLEEITGKAVSGFRMARLQPVSDRAIAEAGYTYNSSMNPTYLPGRYNHLDKPRTAYFHRQTLQLPVSVTPWVRFPLFWLSFKNLPLPLYQWACRWTLYHDAYLSLYFHPWEFAEIGRFQLPGYVKNNCGRNMVNRMGRYLTWLKTQGEFVTCREFYDYLTPNPMNPEMSSWGSL